VVGEDWEQTIEQNLADAEEVIVVLSAHAIASKWVQHEGSIVYGLKKKMFPVLIEEIPPEDLPIWASKFQYHSFIASDYPAALRGLVAALRAPNPIRDLLDRKKIEYNAYQSLMQAKELELVAADLENSTLELDDADRRLLLYSAVALERVRHWLELAGEAGRPWLREALTQPDTPSAVRSGAAACLGDVSDSPTYDQLCQAGLSPQGRNSRQETLDLLALFLHHSPKKFEVPGRIRMVLFLRLARLRIKDGAIQRIRMRKTASFFALFCILILMLSIYIQFEFFASANNDWGNYVVGALFFAIPGFVTAYGFAEVMTSLMLIITRWRFTWQIFVLVITGSVIGIALFYLLAGDHGVWFAGGVIGLALALFNHKPSLKTGWYPGLLSLIIGLLMFALSLVALAEIKEGRPIELIGSAISTSLFTSMYIFIYSRTE
jgi:hypothetical protein